MADCELPRREFLRALVRTGLVGLLVGGTGALALRRGCRVAGACEVCPALDACDLPQAARARPRGTAPDRSDPSDPTGKRGSNGR